MNRIWAVQAMLATAIAAGCQESGDDGFNVDATGTVEGLVWLDSNGNGVRDGSDALARDVGVTLSAPVGGGVLYSAETNAAGEFLMDDVLVGDYRAAVDIGSIGDTLRVLRVDSAEVTVAAEAISTVEVGLTYPRASTRAVRTMAPDRTVFVEGRVISEWDTFGDGSVFVRDSTGAIQVLRTEPSGARAGDSVRVRAATGLQDGQVVLRDGTVFLVATGIESPDPESVTTGTAAAADEGRLDAELVRIENAVVQDTLRNALGERVLRVDDGSGAVDIVLDRDIPFPTVPQTDLIGAEVDASGVLVVPAAGAAWVVKPRDNADIVVTPASQPGAFNRSSAAPPRS